MGREEVAERWSDRLQTADKSFAALAAADRPAQSNEIFNYPDGPLVGYAGVGFGSGTIVYSSAMAVNCRTMTGRLTGVNA